MKILQMTLIVCLVFFMSASTTLAYEIGNLFITGESAIEDTTGNHTITKNGDTQISSAQKQFGDYSIYVDGVGDCLSLPQSNDWNFGSSDFTIDAWVYYESGHMMISTISWNNPTITGTLFGIINQKRLQFWNGANNVGTVGLITSVDSITPGNWYHIAIVRNGNNFYLFLNGQIMSQKTNSPILTDSTGELVIGRYYNNSNSAYGAGYFDNVRITKGTALWTQNFDLTAEALFYPNSGDVPISEIALLEVTENGKVSINTVLHLEPLSNPPEPASDGDIYFTTTKELLIYADSKWHGIYAALATHDTEHLTSGSGTWKVPAGIYSIQVTMAAGGGSNGAGCAGAGIPANGYWEGCPGYSRYGGTGGIGGVLLNNYIDVTPGQSFPYSVGGVGGSSTFGNLIVTGGGNGTNASCPNSCVSGSNGSNGAAGSPYEGPYPNGTQGNPNTGGAIYIEY